MLVLSRKSGESVKIGDKIRVTVYAAGRVRVGIDAPKDVKIIREKG